MSHLLIIKDRSGKELAKVPIEAGWSFVEVPLPKAEAEKPAAPATDVGVSDKGRGASKV